MGGKVPQVVQQPLVLEPILEEERVAYFAEEYAALVGDYRRLKPEELRGIVSFSFFHCLECKFLLFFFRVDEKGYHRIRKHCPFMFDSIRTGKCFVEYPRVGEAIRDICGERVKMEMSFDTRLLSRGIRGRILTLSLSKPSCLKVAIEWFVEFRDYFQRLCQYARDTPPGSIESHIEFCNDGRSLPRQERVDTCVPIMRVDFVLVKQCDGEKDWWTRRHRVLTLSFINQAGILNFP